MTETHNFKFRTLLLVALWIAVFQAWRARAHVSIDMSLPHRTLRVVADARGTIASMEAWERA